MESCCTTSSKRCSWINEEKYNFRIPSCEKQNLFNILLWVSSVLNKYTWMISYGTLLGSIREKSLINHDTDIDIEVDIKHMSQIYASLEEKNNLRPQPYYIKAVKEVTGTFSEPIVRVFFSKINEIHVDIWPFKKINNTHVYRYHKTEDGLVEHELMFPTKNCELHGYYFPCPQNSEMMLKLKYGDYSTPKSKYLHPIHTGKVNFSYIEKKYHSLEYI